MRHFLLAIIILFTASIFIRAQPLDTTNVPVFFYNAADGTGEYGTVDLSGSYNRIQTYTGFSTGWTHIVYTKNGYLFFYNSNTGNAVVGSIDPNTGGFFNINIYPGWLISAGWTHVVAIPSGGIFFYQASTGIGRVGRITGAGSYYTQRSFSGFAKGWTSIASGSGLTPWDDSIDRNISFYNKVTGFRVQGVIGSNGNYADRAAARYPPGFTHHVMNSRGGAEALYNSNTGGTYAWYGSSQNGSIASGHTHFTGLGLNDTYYGFDYFLYNSNNGFAESGHIWFIPGYNFVTTGTFPEGYLASGYTHVVFTTFWASSTSGN